MEEEKRVWRYRYKRSPYCVETVELEARCCELWFDDEEFVLQRSEENETGNLTREDGQESRLS
jgi:hypothetical protein